MSKEAMEMPDCWVVIKNGQIIATHDEPAHIDGIQAVRYVPAQQEIVATITITQRGSTRTIDNHFEDCVRDWPDGEYKLYTAPPAPVQQEPKK